MPQMPTVEAYVIVTNSSGQSVTISVNELDAAHIPICPLMTNIIGGFGFNAEALYNALQLSPDAFRVALAAQGQEGIA